MMSPVTTQLEHQHRRRRRRPAQSIHGNTTPEVQEGSPSPTRQASVLEPLLSITLCPLTRHHLSLSSRGKTQNKIKKVEEEDDVLSNPLLRSCVKRLLIGKKIISNHGNNSEGIQQYSFANLAVKVPSTSYHATNQNIGDGSRQYDIHEYQIVDFQSASRRGRRGNDRNENDGRSPRKSEGYQVGEHGELRTINAQNHYLLVILPSTRIIFQAMMNEYENESENGAGVIQKGTENNQHQPQQLGESSFNIETKGDNSSPIPQHPANDVIKFKFTSTMPPHQHILSSLKSILSYQNNNEKHNYSFQHNHRPPIPRSFLFTGPPGVGKTYSVKKAIQLVGRPHTHANTDTNTNTNTNTNTTKNNSVAPKIHLISLRGSELLASAEGGQSSNAARELERQFYMAAKMCSGQQRRRRVDNHGNNVEILSETATAASSEAEAAATVIFLDECDALVSSSVVAAMLALLLDKMEGGVDTNNNDHEYDNQENNSGWGNILLVAATNRIDAIPAYLRRPGRLEKEIVVSPPNVQERLELLKSMIGSSENSNMDIDIQSVAEACVGYVAADLSALVRKAAMLGMEKRFHDSPLAFNKNNNVINPSSSLPSSSPKHSSAITTRDLFDAMNEVGASSLRDANLAAPPKTTWNDIAGDVGGAKRAIRQAIEWPRIHKSAFLSLGLTPPRGVLLHGPPGCAKTTLARAAAGAAGVAFLSLSPAEVYASSFVGEAEAVVRRAFTLARSAAPCVLFFDEIDSIIGGEDGSSGGGGGGHGMGRGMSGGRGISAEARVLSTFLNEMDGVDGSVEDGVLVLGATNRPGTLDAALLRPGRFDRVIYVPPPDEAGRKAILTMECTKWRDSLFAHSSIAGSSLTEIEVTNSINNYFDIDVLASDAISGSMTGAELVGACRETAVTVLREMMQPDSDLVLKKDFSKEMVEKLMQSLKHQLETMLKNTTPLLSDPNVLEEYTRFEEEHH